MGSRACNVAKPPVLRENNQETDLDYAYPSALGVLYGILNVFTVGQC